MTRWVVEEREKSLKRFLVKVGSEIKLREKRGEELNKKKNDEQRW